MKKNIPKGIVSAGTVILLLISCNKQSGQVQNLIINGSTELPKYDSVPVNWLNVQGHWVSMEGDSVHHDFGFAKDGKYYFFAGNDTLGILQQDVNVSDYAAGIDARKQQFIFSGDVQSLDQGPNSDQSQIILTGLDNSKSKILYKYDSDTIRSIGKWRSLTDTFNAPAGTRFIRVRLLAIRHVGGDNDGYFDNLVLTATPQENNFKKPVIFIAAALVALVIIFGAISKHKKGQKLPAGSAGTAYGK